MKNCLDYYVGIILKKRLLRYFSYIVLYLNMEMFLILLDISLTHPPDHMLNRLANIGVIANTFKNEFILYVN